MKKFLLLLIACTGMSVIYSQSISYDVSFPNLAHHEANIFLTVSGLPLTKATFRMSRSSPGRYATHEFGKNVYDVKAWDQAGKSITINRVDGDIYEVPQHKGFIKVGYTIYGNYPDGTYVGFDQTSIHINMPATFMWIKGYDSKPIKVKFNIPDGKNWTIATQLKTTSDPWAFTAPGLQYFMDCPTKIGDLRWREWTIKNPNGKSYRFRFALEATGPDSAVTGFAEKVHRITEEEQAVYGETPDYDYGMYTFIASINTYVKGDGMEHRNSTMISIPTNFSNGDFLLEVFAHEFFHCWNVERIRPKTIEPFNFEKSNMSHELWCAEGFTQYYGDLIVTRAGFQSEDEYLQTIAGLVNTKENTPGARRFSPAQNSNHAVFTDAGVSIDRNNYANMFTSYYPLGASIAMALDLTLRTKYKLTLDDYMTALWKRFGKTEIAYTIPGLQEVLAQVTKDKAFAADFFTRYITGHESFDYKPLLEKAGFILKRSAEGKAWIGNAQYREAATLTISSNTIWGTPLYQAGLDIDDQVLKLDGKNIQKQADISEVLSNHKPGDVVNIEYRHRGESKTGSLTLGENPALHVTAYEKEGLPVTDEIIQFRKSWLGTKVK